MAKLTLSDLVNLNNPTSVVSILNNNAAAIEAAIENTLSRDGSSPNEMNANLDMNSHRILNLPAPVSLNEPVRLQDVAGGSLEISIQEEGVAFNTLASIAAADIADDINVIRIHNYAETGDGGGMYLVRSASEPTTGTRTQDANGVWWGIYEIRPNILQFGADNTGTIDCSTAFKNFVEHLIDKELEGYLPGGDYKVDTLTEISLSSYKHFAIRGAGMYATRIKCSSINSGGWLKITTSGGTVAWSSITLSDFWIYPENTSGSTAGFTFNPAGSGTSQKRSISIYNVHIGSDHDAAGSLGYFVTGIDLTGCRRPYLNNVRVNGVYGTSTGTFTEEIDSFSSGAPGVVNIAGHGLLTGDIAVYSAGGGTPPGNLTDGARYYITVIDANSIKLSANENSFFSGTYIEFLDTGSGSNHSFAVQDYRDESDSFYCEKGIVVDNCYFPELVNCVSNRCGVGFSIRGTSHEAAYLINPICTAVKIGIDFYRTSPQPDIWIWGGQMNYRDIGISLDGVRAFWIVNHDFRQSPISQRSTRANGPTDVYIANASNRPGTIMGSYHELQGDSRRTAYTLGDASTSVQNLQIYGPVIAGRFNSIVRIENSACRGIAVINPVFAPTILASDITAYVNDTTSTDSRAVQWMSFYEDSGTESKLRIQTFHSSATDGPTIQTTKRKTGVATDNDIIGFLEAQGVNDAANPELVTYARRRVVTTDVSDGSEDGRVQEYVMVDGTLTERMRLDPSGVGFNGSSAGKPTVTGSKGSNAALTSLLTGLASIGLITDSSS